MIALFFALIFFLIDLYFYQAVVQVTANLSSRTRTVLRFAFWIPSVLSVLAMLWWTFDNPFRYSANLRNWIITGLMATYFSKIVGVLFLLAGDLVRAFRWLAQAVTSKADGNISGPLITRAEFFSKAAVVAHREHALKRYHREKFNIKQKALAAEAAAKKAAVNYALERAKHDRDFVNKVVSTNDAVKKKALPPAKPPAKKAGPNQAKLPPKKRK